MNNSDTLLHTADLIVMKPSGKSLANDHVSETKVIRTTEAFHFIKIIKTSEEPKHSQNMISVWSKSLKKQSITTTTRIPSTQLGMKEVKIIVAQIA